MSFVERIVGDLREKRLWPLAVVLLAALVAVPVLLSKGGSSTPPVAQAPAADQPSPPTGVPVVSSASAPGDGRLRGLARDPFSQPLHGATSGVASAISATTGASTGAGSTGTIPTPTTGVSSTGSSTITPSTTTPSTTTTIPTQTPKPAPAGLKATQSYEVKLAITNSSGGLDTIDPLERLSVLPSKQQPLLVELGVLKGGNRVLFAVQPGTVATGPGSCIPGPIDCELLSLGQDQTESVGTQSSNGVRSVALFAVTGITAASHSSVAAANKAREATSGAGRALLSGSTSSALSLFRYEASVGTLVDLRNLTVEG